MPCAVLKTQYKISFYNKGAPLLISFRGKTIVFKMVGENAAT